MSVIKSIEVNGLVCKFYIYKTHSNFFSAGQPQPNKSAENGNANMVDMSKSLASFHLSSGSNLTNPAQSVLRNKAMDESVDHLFKEGESVAPQEGSSKGKKH